MGLGFQKTNQDKGISSLHSPFSVFCYKVGSGKTFYSFLNEKWINTRNAEHLSVYVEQADFYYFLKVIYIIQEKC